MRLFKISFVFSVFILLLCSCSNKPNSAPESVYWDKDDPSCKLTGMRHICLRKCKATEMGPSGALCVNKLQGDYVYCDCGTRKAGPSI